MDNREKLIAVKENRIANLEVANSPVYPAYFQFFWKVRNLKLYGGGGDLKVILEKQAGTKL